MHASEGVVAGGVEQQATGGLHIARKQTTRTAAVTNADGFAATALEVGDRRIAKYITCGGVATAHEQGAFARDVFVIQAGCTLCRIFIHSHARCHIHVHGIGRCVATDEPEVERAHAIGQRELGGGLARGTHHQAAHVVAGEGHVALDVVAGSCTCGRHHIGDGQTCGAAIHHHAARQVGVDATCCGDGVGTDVFKNTAARHTESVVV